MAVPRQVFNAVSDVLFSVKIIFIERVRLANWCTLVTPDYALSSLIGYGKYAILAILK